MDPNRNRKLKAPAVVDDHDDDVYDHDDDVYDHDDDVYKHCVETDTTTCTGKPSKRYTCNYCHESFSCRIGRFKQHVLLVPKTTGIKLCPVLTQPPIPQQLTTNQDRPLKKRKIYDDEWGCGSSSGAHVVQKEQVFEQRVLRSTKERKKFVDVQKEQVVEERVKERKNLVDDSMKKVYVSVGKFFIINNIDLSVSESKSFKEMIKSVSNDKFKAPNFNDSDAWVFKDIVSEIRSKESIWEVSFKKWGGTLLVDASNLGENIFIFMSVHTYYGRIFLKSFNATDILKSSKKLTDVFKSVIEEVGSMNLVQIMLTRESDGLINEDVRKDIKASFPCIMWSHCFTWLFLILDDFKKIEWVDTVYNAITYIVNFLESDILDSSLLEELSDGLVHLRKEEVSDSWFSFYNFLENIVSLKDHFADKMFCQEWLDVNVNVTPSRKEKVSAFEKLILNAQFWERCVEAKLLIDPILKVVKGLQDIKGSVAYVLAGVYRVKEKIRNAFFQNGEYIEYWDIIDERWKKHANVPQCSSGFFLNPKFTHSNEAKLKSRLFDQIEILERDASIQGQASMDVKVYIDKEGDFGREMAKLDKDNPVLWWDAYGMDLRLKSIALRILSQSCCLLSYEPNNTQLKWLMEREKEHLNKIQSKLSFNEIFGNTKLLGEEMISFIGEDFKDQEIFKGLC